MHTDLEDFIQDQFIRFVENDQRNVMPNHNMIPIYDSPLLGIASVTDPIFDSFKNPDIIGAHYITPKEWMIHSKSVVSYFLPFSQQVRDSNQKPGMPSEEWVFARIDGENFNDFSRTFLIELFVQMGHEAIAPVFDPRFKNLGLSSNWSERHAAYVAGLGTFGLHQALISSKGCAGRYGSVITSCELTPTIRSYQNYYEYCPFLMHGSCGACIRRCPSGALSVDGKNKITCDYYIESQIKSKYMTRWGCAKCNLNVPCEERIPVL